MILPNRSPILVSGVGRPIPTALAAWYRYNTGITSSGGTVSAWANQTGGEALVQATAANQPYIVRWDGTNYAIVPNDGSVIFAPDSNELDITGDVSLLWYGYLNNWTLAADQTLVCKRNNASTGISYGLEVASGGAPRFYVSSNGTAVINFTATASPAVSNGSPLYVLAVYDADNGSSEKTVKFYTGTSIDNLTQLGNEVVSAGVITTFVSTSVLSMGGQQAGGQRGTGGIFSSKVYDGAVGVSSGSIDATGATLVFDADFSAQTSGTRTFSESALGATVTLPTSKSIIGSIDANTIYFDGVANFLKTAPFTLNQPTTVYFLGRQVTYNTGRSIFDGNAASSGLLFQEGGTPSIRINAGATIAVNNNGLTIGTYLPVAVVFNGASSLVQVASNDPVTGNAGTNNMGAFTLGARGDGASPGNAQAKEVLIYNVAHDANQRAAVIAYLNMVNQL
jgi:hypothetical protein